jgi:hypothetical protein
MFQRGKARFAATIPSLVSHREPCPAASDTFALRSLNREEILAARKPLDWKLEEVLRAKLGGESIGGKLGDVVKYDAIAGVGNARCDGRRECGRFGILIDA